MTRAQLEHILRASAGITGADRFIVIGSQAILGKHPDAPAELLISHELDVFTLRSPEDAVLIDGSIGEESPFHRTFGYYAHGVGIESATLPGGWQDRLVEVRSAATGGASGMCLDPADLAVSKLVAGRDKDIEFVAAMLRHRLISKELLEKRLAETMLDSAVREKVPHCLARAAALHK